LRAKSSGSWRARYVLDREFGQAVCVELETLVIVREHDDAIRLEQPARPSAAISTWSRCTSNLARMRFERKQKSSDRVTKIMP